MFKAIICDIDGTLLDNEHHISLNTLYAINELKKKGIMFVISSGRSPSGIYNSFNQSYLADAIVAYSGGYILNDNGEEIFSKGFSKNQAKEILEVVKNSMYDCTPCIYANDEWIVNNKNDKRIINEIKVVNYEPTIGDINSVSSKIIHKILCICNPLITEKLENYLKEKFPCYTIMKSSNIMLEVMIANMNKMIAVEQFCKYYNIKKDEIIAFGDYYNDEEMLVNLPYGYVMDNAPLDLKQKIKNHAKSNVEDGIYHTLVDLKIIDERSE